jgi:hypothetical protein
MELRHLRYFIAVAELRSVRAASEQLHVTQPALRPRGKSNISKKPSGLRCFNARHAARCAQPQAKPTWAEAREVLARIDAANRLARHIASGMHGQLVHPAGQAPGDGEVWIDLIDGDGETLFDQVACFHRANASDALQIHFGMNVDVVRDCFSKSNIAALHARHRLVAQAYFRKIDRLVDCSLVGSMQSNRRRVGDASVMDLVIELRRRLDGVVTQLALSELPTPVSPFNIAAPASG